MLRDQRVSSAASSLGENKPEGRSCDVTQLAVLCFESSVNKSGGSGESPVFSILNAVKANPAFFWPVSSASSCHVPGDCSVHGTALFQPGKSAVSKHKGGV